LITSFKKLYKMNATKKDTLTTPNMIELHKKSGAILSKTILILILIFFTFGLYANETKDIYMQALKAEKRGDFKKAMLLYKKAVSLSFKPKKQESFLKKDDNKTILKYGHNEIKGYGNKSTDENVKQLIFSSFDAKPYKMNYLLPFTYDNVAHPNRLQSETKFQISFKKSLGKNIFGFRNELFFAYTQQSWWQTSAASTPFRESNYEPELFMMFPYASKNSPLKAYKIGVLHQSNGQGGLLSRSWNRIYLTGIFQQDGAFIIPRIWYRIPEHTKANINDANGDDNPDIYNYLGYGDLEISYPYKKHLFSLLLRNNLKFKSGNKGAVQFDWTFPLPWISDTFGYLQIFSGYGESLIDYNKRNDKIGIGFAITR